MTPTEQWILDLVLVYAVPAFMSGVAITLLLVRWRDIRREAAMMPRFLSPDLTFEGRDLIADGTTPEDEAHSLLADRLRLR